MRIAWYGIAALVLMLTATAHQGAVAAEIRLGDMSISTDTRNAFTLKFRETVLLQDGAAQVRTDWKSPPLMDLLREGESLPAEELPGAKRLVLKSKKSGVGSLRRDVLLLPGECIIQWDTRLDMQRESFLGKVGVLIPHETITGRSVRLIDRWGRSLAGKLGEENGSPCVYVRTDGGYTKIGEHLDVLPGALAPDFRVPGARQLVFDIADRTVCLDLSCEADGEYVVGELEGDARTREPYRLSVGFVSKAKSCRLRAVLRVRVLEGKGSKTEFEQWTLNKDLLDVIDDGFSLTARRDRKWMRTGEPVRVKVDCVGVRDLKDELPVKYVLTDYWDKVVEHGAFKLSRDSNAPPGKPLSFSVEPTGMYRLTLSYNVPGTDRVRKRQAIFAVLPRLADLPRDTLFGAHVPLTEYYAKLASAAGVNWVRLWHTTLFRQNMWNAVEPKRGQFTFDDREIRLAKKYGFNLLGVLQGVPTWFSPRKKGEAYSSGFEDMDKVLPLWIEFVRRTVGHYKDSIKCWEVLNEPGFSHKFFRKRPEVYVRLLKATHAAIKSVDPDAVVIGSNGPVGWGMNWFEKVFELDGLDYQDAVSVHYASRRKCTTPDWDIEGAQAIRFIRNLMRKRGDVKPIWNTEDHVWIDGFFYHKTPRAEERDTGRYDVSSIPIPVYHETCNRLLRLYLMHMKENARVFYLHWFGNGWWHLCERDHTPTPPIVAHAVMADLLAGAEYKEHLVGNGIQCHLFRCRAGSPIAVVFAHAKDARGTLVIPLDTRKLRAINIMGNQFALPAVKPPGGSKPPGGRGLTVAEEPVYLVGKGMSLENFATAIREAKLALPNGALAKPWKRSEKGQRD